MYKPNCPFWSENNSQEIIEKILHSAKSLAYGMVASSDLKLRKAMRFFLEEMSMFSHQDGAVPRVTLRVKPLISLQGRYSITIGQFRSDL